MTVESQVGDPRFFARRGPHSFAEIARAAGATTSDGNARAFSNIAPLNAAGPDDVSFITEKRHLPALQATRAGAVLVTAALAPHVPVGAAALVVRDAHVAWARVAALFYSVPPPSPGVHPTAFVDPAAAVDQSAEIGPFAVVEPGASVGARARIGPHVCVGRGVMIGADTRLGAHVVVSHAIIGDRVVVLPGTRIGQDGFGFAMTETGFVSVPQVGRVVIESDVEIGAGCAIDRGSAADTVIGMGTRLDNLVQVGHNVRIGRFCVIVAQVGISGSTVLEDFVMVGGQAGFVGHLRIGAKARIGAKSGVTRDVAPGANMLDTPARPYKDYVREQILLRRLTRKLTAGDEAVS